ncbi:MAG: RNA polymerase sigma factor [Clostridia bacterium]|nr:RNA polymerase sigma factor [Clostridia bacterium]
MDFESIYAEYKQDVFRYLFSLTGSYEAAEELLAETFFRAFTGLCSFRGESSVRTWLFSISRNVFREYLRRNPRAIPTEDETLALMCVQSGMIQPDESASFELSELVGQLLAKKDERSRRVFRLRLEGYSFREIGGMVGISENSARVLEYRTRSYLQKELRKEGYGHD